MPTPWTTEKRSQIKRKIDREAKHSAGRLGAAHVVVIAFFPDGEFLHMQDGGSAPMPFEQLYKQMSGVMATLKESGGEDVQMQ